MSRTKLLILLAVALLVMVPAAGLAQEHSELEGQGTAVISDRFALSDAITYSMTGVSDPGEGMAYEGWVVNDDVKTSTGVMTVIGGNIDHFWSSPDGENLIHLYDTVLITVEPVPDDDPAPSGVIAFSDQMPVPARSMANIRRLLADDDAGKGVLTGLKDQLGVAITHATLAAGAGTMEERNQHLAHVVNVIEGPGGPNYNADAGDPGDGTGVMTYAQNRSYGPMAAAGAPNDAEVVAGAALVDEYGANVEMWAAQARDKALELMESSIAVQLIHTVSGPLEAALNGISATGEGGASQAYVEAQKMATYTLTSGEPPMGPPRPELPITGDAGIPLAAQAALVAGFVILAAGALIVLRSRRSRASV